MSGQCLSPSETGHALTPANHLCLGRPLPHQQANSKQTAPRAINLWSGDIIRYYLQFPAAIPDPWVRIYSLLSLSPLSTLKINRSIFLKLLVRLACLIHAANVHSEPGSNPSIVCLLERGLPSNHSQTTSKILTTQRADSQLKLPKLSRLV